MPRAHVSALLTFLERLDLRIERAVLLVDLVDLGLDFLQLVAGWSFFLRTRQHAHTHVAHTCTCHCDNGPCFNCSAAATILSTTSTGA